MKTRATRAFRPLPDDGVVLLFRFWFWPLLNVFARRGGPHYKSNAIFWHSIPEGFSQVGISGNVVELCFSRRKHDGVQAFRLEYKLADCTTSGAKLISILVG